MNDKAKISHGKKATKSSKTTLMDRRVPKEKNRTGKQGMVYKSGKYPS